MYNNYGGSFGSSCGCGGYGTPYMMPYNQYGCGNNSNFAIILVLFILLVIIIGSRCCNN